MSGNGQARGGGHMLIKMHSGGRGEENGEHNSSECGRKGLTIKEDKGEHNSTECGKKGLTKHCYDHRGDCPDCFKELHNFDECASFRNEQDVHLGRGFTHKKGNLAFKKYIMQFTRQYNTLRWKKDGEKSKFAHELHKQSGSRFIRKIEFKNEKSGWFDVGLHFDKEQRFRDMIKLPPGLMTKPMCKKLLGTLGFRTDDSFINFLNRSEFPKVKNKPKNLHADVADISCYPGQISFASDRTENSLIYSIAHLLNIEIGPVQAMKIRHFVATVYNEYQKDEVVAEKPLNFTFHSAMVYALLKGLSPKEPLDPKLELICADQDASTGSQFTTVVVGQNNDTPMFLTHTKGLFFASFKCDDRPPSKPEKKGRSKENPSAQHSAVFAGGNGATKGKTKTNTNAATHDKSKTKRTVAQEDGNEPEERAQNEASNGCTNDSSCPIHQRPPAPKKQKVFAPIGLDILDGHDSLDHLVFGFGGDGDESRFDSSADYSSFPLKEFTEDDFPHFEGLEDDTLLQRYFEEEEIMKLFG